MLALFKELDVDCTGTLSAENISKVMTRHAGPSQSVITVEEIEAMMASHKLLGGDKELNYEEFVKMLRFSLTRNASMASFASFSHADTPPAGPGPSA